MTRAGRRIDKAVEEILQDFDVLVGHFGVWCVYEFFEIFFENLIAGIDQENNEGKLVRGNQMILLVLWVARGYFHTIFLHLQIVKLLVRHLRYLLQVQRVEVLVKDAL